MTKSAAKLQNVLPKSKAHAPKILFLEIVIGIILSLLSLLSFAYITEDILKKEGVNIDTAISQAVYTYRSPVLTDLMYSLSFLGGGFIMIATLIIMSILILKNYKREAMLLFILVLGGHLITGLIKYLLQVPRPTLAPLYIEKLYSFPSGHAMNSFIFYAGLAYLTFHLTRNRLLSILLSAVAVILIFLIGFSRIYLGVHFPSDVIAGFIAGFWWLVTVILIDKTLTFYKIRKLPKV